MKLELILVLFLAFASVFSSCQALYWQYRPEVTFNVGTFDDVFVGRYAEYGHYKAELVSSTLVLIPEVGFGCPRYSPNVTTVLSSIVGSFVVMIPMDLTLCSDYQKATAAKHLGASGVLFYYSNSDSRQFSSGSGLDRLSIPVASIEISEDSLNALQEQLRISNSTQLVSIIGNYYQSLPTSQTFYFVVFSFCILTLLSCLWFVLSYVRKCRTRAQRRRRRAQNERETRQLLNTLPTKTHKSRTGVEEPTCAICLDLFHNKDTIRVLPCQHEYHKRCIDPWLKLKKTCPMCKEDISTKTHRSPPRSVSVSSDEASSMHLLSNQRGSQFSLESSSSEGVADVGVTVVGSESGEERQHTAVVMLEGETVDHEASSQSASSEEGVAIEIEPSQSPAADHE